MPFVLHELFPKEPAEETKGRRFTSDGWAVVVGLHPLPLNGWSR